VNVTIYDMDQRSEDWLAARCGKVTGSRAADLFATRKDGKEAAPRRDYRMQLALERALGKPLDDDGYKGRDVVRGIELEAEALMAYEAFTGSLVRRTGFVAHNELPIGCSLDGDCDDLQLLIEVKAPRPATHWAYLQADAVPEDYIPQLVHNQLVTGAPLTHFVSYCPQFGPKALWIKPFPRDENQIASYRLALAQFLDDVTRDELAVRTSLIETAVA
jgi:hypothetical protein